MANHEGISFFVPFLAGEQVILQRVKDHELAVEIPVGDDVNPSISLPSFEIRSEDREQIMMDLIADTQVM